MFKSLHFFFPAAPLVDLQATQPRLVEKIPGFQVPNILWAQTDIRKLLEQMGWEVERGQVYS